MNLNNIEVNSYEKNFDIGYNAGGLYRFRRELIEELIKQGYEVYLSAPYRDELELLKSKGAKIVDTFVDRRGLNPITDSKLVLRYFKMVYDVKPDIIMTYTNELC